MANATHEAGHGPLPRQIPYIIANEGAERFSFYGMRNILTPFLISTLLLFVPLADRTGEAKHVFHTFVIGVYFFPLLGGFLADRFFGKYNTIFWLSLVYVAGHACLAIFEDNLTGFYFGLFLIAWARAASSRWWRPSSATSSTTPTRSGRKSSTTRSTGSSTSARSSRRC
jgi:POT family proton-dependent oligopeptide transporter